MKIKKGDIYIDRCGKEGKCLGFGGNLSLTDTRKNITNEYGISAPCELIKYKEGGEYEYINIHRIIKIIKES